jgi:hypothetical protein
MKRFVVFVFALLLSTSAFAQDKVPQLTELERYKLERLALLQQIDALTKELSGWQQLYAGTAKKLADLDLQVQKKNFDENLKAVVEGIEAARPGFKFDPASGKFIPVKKEK